MTRYAKKKPRQATSQGKAGIRGNAGAGDVVYYLTIDRLFWHGRITLRVVRLDSLGALQHLVLRANKKIIFRDDPDEKNFLDRFHGRSKIPKPGWSLVSTVFTFWFCSLASSLPCRCAIVDR